MRHFDSGATRDSDESKWDYEGFLHPLVLERFAEYMHENRVQADGKLRDSDNWQKGIPKDAYMKSAFRHFMDIWKEHRGIETKDGMEKAICALMFNVMGYLFEILKEKKSAEEEVFSAIRTGNTVAKEPEAYSDGVPFIPYEKPTWHAAVSFVPDMD